MVSEPGLTGQAKPNPAKSGLDMLLNGLPSRNILCFNILRQLILSLYDNYQCTDSSTGFLTTKSIISD